MHSPEKGRQTEDEKTDMQGHFVSVAGRYDTYPAPPRDLYREGWLCPVRHRRICGFSIVGSCVAAILLDQHGYFHGCGTWVCSCCCSCGVYIAKGKFRGREILFLVYVIVMMMPFQVTQLPHYMTAKSLGTYDTPWALLLPGIFAPLSVFLLTQLTRAIPDEMLEAARVETDSVWKILWYIVCPNLRSGIVCMMVLQFTEYWGMAAEPLVLMETKDMYPLALKLAQAGTDIPAAVVASLVMLIPPWLLYGYFQKEIREGMKGYFL